MKKEEVKIISLLNKYANNPILESKYEYNRFDAFNDLVIIELKYRGKHYDQTMIEFSKFSYNYMYANLMDKKFIYVVRMMDLVYVFNITDLVKEKYNFNFSWRDLPKTTEFKRKEDIKKFVGYIDIDKAIKKYII